MTMNNVTKLFLGGMKWTGLSTIVVTVVQLLQFALLARLLSKEDFGLMGMIMVVIVFSQVFTDMGISSAIVHRQDLNKKHLSSLYWLNILAGIAVFAILLLIIPYIADFYNEPKLKELLFYIAFIFLITPLGQQFQFLMQKELKFNSLAKIEIVSVVLGSTSAVLLAILDYGVWSLVWGQIITNSVKSLLLMTYGWKTWRPALRFKGEDLKGYISFGAYQMGSRSVNYFASNIDYILIGRFLGTEALGIYSLAYQLIVIPVTKINPVITKVAFPVFSLNQKNDEIINQGFIQMTKMLSFVTFPILIGLIAVSDILVPVVFGAKWIDAVPVIQILAVLGLLRVLMNPNGSVLLAKGRADLGFMWDLGVAIINGLAIYLVVNQGVLAVAIAYVAVSFINFILGRKLLHHVTKLKAGDYFRSLRVPAIISILMAIIVYLLVLLSVQIGLQPSWVLLIVLVLIGALSYVFLAAQFDKSLFNKVISMVLKRKAKNA